MTLHELAHALVQRRHQLPPVDHRRPRRDLRQRASPSAPAGPPASPASRGGARREAPAQRVGELQLRPAGRAGREVRLRHVVLRGRRALRRDRAGDAMADVLTAIDAGTRGVRGESGAGRDPARRAGVATSTCSNEVGGSERATDPVPPLRRLRPRRGRPRRASRRPRGVRPLVERRGRLGASGSRREAMEAWQFDDAGELMTAAARRHLGARSVRGRRGRHRHRAPRRGSRPGSRRRPVWSALEALGEDIAELDDALGVVARRRRRGTRRAHDARGARARARGLLRRARRRARDAISAGRSRRRRASSPGRSNRRSPSPSPSAGSGPTSWPMRP